MGRKTVLEHDQLVEIIRLKTQEDLGSRAIAKMFGVGKSTINNFLSRLTHKEFWESYDVRPVAAGEIHTPEARREVLTGKRYVFTSAQNNTFVHDKFLESLLHYCAENDAELIVSTFSYNLNGFHNLQKFDEETEEGQDRGVWFDPKIRPYICDRPLQVAEDLVFCGELNILPTAVNPLSGLHNYTAINSAIVPHAKLQLESVPTPQGDNPKLMYTTGTVTQRNYIQMKAGQKAEWHHAFAALVVEIDEDGDWFARQLNCESDTGCFYDLGWYYTPKGRDELQHDISAVQLGDIHVDKLSEEVAELCWGKSEDSVLGYLQPDKIFIHDVHDHARRNHHNMNDPYFLFKQFTAKKESVEEEVLRTTEVLEAISYHGEAVVVESNHDLALERWLKEQDYRRDPVNAVFFLKLQLENYEAMERGEDLETFKTACYLVDSSALRDVTFLTTDQSYRIHGIEMGQHGHNGANGARGSIAAFVKQGIKFNIGHSHSANIKDGVYQAGACMRVEDAGYTKGGSSWSISHIVTYANGKRAIITCRNGKWRA